jgi:hypothetical protein
MSFQQILPKNWTDPGFPDLEIDKKLALSVYLAQISSFDSLFICENLAARIL